MTVLKEKTKLVQKPPKPKKFNVREVEKLYQVGLLKPDEKVELINGEIYKMSPIGLRHAVVVNGLAEELSKIILKNEELEKKFMVQVQNPLRLSLENLLQPDIAVLKRDYIKQNRYPEVKDTELIIEVSDTTLNFDKNVKLTLYAKYGIEKVWIVNLVEDQIEIYENPSKNKYRDIHIRTKDEKIKIFDKEIKISDFLK
ncbi:Uma2 family endonuclease [Persephonella sp.]